MQARRDIQKVQAQIQSGEGEVLTKNLSVLKSRARPTKVQHAIAVRLSPTSTSISTQQHHRGTTTTTHNSSSNAQNAPHRTYARNPPPKQARANPHRPQAVGQLTSTSSLLHNLAQCQTLITKAVAAGAQVPPPLPTLPTLPQHPVSNLPLLPHHPVPNAPPPP